MQPENWNAATYDAPRRRLVPCYDAFYGTPVDLVRRLAPTRPRVLDLGAGTGLLSAELVARVEVASLTLIDGSREMLAVAERRLIGQSPQVRCADLRAELPAESFDVIMSALAIHHLEDDDKRKLYRRIFAQLAPGGLFINAEQVAHPEACGEKVFEVMHLEKARELGSGSAEIKAAAQRMEADRCAPAEAQVRWLNECGFVASSVYYQWFRFAVFAGCKPPVSLPK